MEPLYYGLQHDQGTAVRGCRLSRIQSTTWTQEWSNPFIKERGRLRPSADECCGILRHALQEPAVGTVVYRHLGNGLCRHSSLQSNAEEHARHENGAQIQARRAFPSTSCMTPSRRRGSPGPTSCSRMLTTHPGLRCPTSTMSPREDMYWFAGQQRSTL